MMNTKIHSHLVVRECWKYRTPAFLDLKLLRLRYLHFSLMFSSEEIRALCKLMAPSLTHAGVFTLQGK